MRVHYINVEQPEKGEKALRASLGGSPVLPQDQSWPLCRLCKTPMIFFFQFDLMKSFDLPLKSGSHMLVFMCPVHNDVPTQLVDSNNDRLPENYWQKTYGHYALILNKPNKTERTLESDSHLAMRTLTFSEAEEEIDWDGQMERGSSGFKVGGVPKWEQGAEYTLCACGAEMIFVCQLPAAFSFPRKKSAPVQPDTVAQDRYNLFLGRPTYIFACKEQCTPYSLYAITQDRSDEMAESA